MYIAFGQVFFDHTRDKMVNWVFQENVVARFVGSIDNDYIHTDSEVNWEELEWLKINNIKHITEFSKLSNIYLVTKKLSPVVSRRLSEISEELDYCSFV